MEKEKEVKAYKVNYLCDYCGKEVEFTGFTAMSYPPQYEHKCKCGEKYYLKKRYPSIEFK